MKKIDKMKKEIEKNRKILNNKLLEDITNNTRNNIKTLQISSKLDKLIVKYMKNRKD